MIERLLGRGGMAEVYAARDTHLRRLVALKRLRSDREDSAATARLLREARAAASFQHPGAVVVYDAFEHEGAAYMAMELVSGRTLRSYVGDASIPIEKRLRWLVDVARALGAAHRAGLVHRDVKPHNVMVRDDGAIKVLDFGIARSHPRAQAPAGEDTAQTLGTLTEAGAVVGTPLYAAPEQLSAAAIDERSDQFAWGVMAYELCCGLLPWRRRDTLTMLAQLVSGDIPTMLQRIADAIAAHGEASTQGATARGAPPPPDPALYADLPLEIEPVLRRAIQREPGERYATIDDAADELEEHAEAPPSMRYVPRPALPSDGSIDLGRSGATPIFREDGSNPSPRPTARSASQGAARAADDSARSTRTPRTEASVTPAGTTQVSGGAARHGAAPSGGTPRARQSSVAIDLPPSIPGPVSSMPISDAASTTGGRIATGGLTADPEPPRSEPPPSQRPHTPIWRRTSVLVGACALLGAIAVGIVSGLRDRPAASSAPAAAQLPVVDRVACAPADVRDAADAPGAPALLGQAACVRVAIALGAPWDPPGATSARGAPLAVTIEGKGPILATLRVGDQSSSASAPRALEAIDAAALALAGKLAAPVRADRSAELGAARPEEARRIEALLRRRAARLGDDPGADLAEVLGLSPSSPWPRLAALTDASGPRAHKLREEVLAGVDALPGPLAEAARGALWLRAAKDDAERDGAAPALRRAYAARPDDGAVAAALVEALLHDGLYDEAAAIGLRIAERAPEQSLAPLAVLVHDGTPDPAWAEQRGKLLERLEVLLPEARAWDARVWHEALAGRVEGARAALDLGDSLGLPSAKGRGWARDLARAAVEIADGKPAAARAFVQPFVGSPSPPEAALATRLLVKTHLLEGHVTDAETALARDIARVEALGDPVRTAERWVALLGIRRRLGMAPPDLADPAKLALLVPALEASLSPLAPALRAELYFVQLARKEKKPADAAEVQAAIEAYARKVARGDRPRHDDLCAAALPVALAGSGQKAFRALWASLDRGRSSGRLPYLLLRGLTSEKAGDDAEAERAYRTLATSPLAADGLDHLAARLHLARLLERLGHKEEAAKWQASTKSILATADEGLLEALARRP